MTLVTEAVVFAAQAHDGAMRKGTQIPYIVHPMEAAAIAAGITEDEEVIAAAVLHDVIEDCGVTAGELAARFGTRVAALVECESQTQWADPCLSWNLRKREAVQKLAHGCRETRIVALADKLSNMRAICRDYERDGEAMFFRFHQQDRRRHAWYYRSCAALLEEELGDTPAWRELELLVERVFGDVPEEDEQGDEFAV